MVGSFQQEIIIEFWGPEANGLFFTFCNICNINLLFLLTYVSIYVASLKTKTRKYQ